MQGGANSTSKPPDQKVKNAEQLTYLSININGNLYTYTDYFKTGDG